MAQFPSTTAADGIWTLKKVRRAILGENWPPLYPIDEYWANTVLLLNTDGASNAGQNNTFLDSSSNAHTITRNGNATQGSFSPFSVDEGKWGNYFDGSSDWLSVPDSTDFDLTGDFTVEAWVYPVDLTDTHTYPTIFSCHDNISGDTWIFSVSNANKVVMYGSGGNADSSTGTVNLNEWSHVAVSREGSTVRFFINGVLDASTYTRTGDYLCTSAGLGIGRQPTGSTLRFWDGYISNGRIVKGTAIYTSSFTPSTAPLTNITNTSLLTCQSNRFVDNSSNAHSLTVNGTPKVVPFSPFPQTTAYSASTNGGSGYFDGSGDWLDGTSSSIVNFGTGDFTVEFWFYTNSVSAQQNLMDNIGNSSYAIYFPAGGGSLNYYVGGNVISGSAISANTWYHVALVRESNSTKMYLNGTQTGSTYSDSNNYAGGATEFPRIGAAFNDTVSVNGYMSNVRIVKGTAVYTSAFTPPTAPLTDITNTSLLCNFTNASIIDATGKNVLETVGNAQVDTTTVKYGTGAMDFDGTGDYLISPSTPQYELTGDFTIEFWLRPANVDGRANTFTIGDSINASGIEVYYSPSQGGWTVFSNNTHNIVTGVSFTGSFKHFALVRNSGVIALYIDGNASSSTWTTSQTFNGDLYVGAEHYNNTVYATAEAYMDDFRITKGIARYTANFTPPVAELPIVGE